ncbi:MAG: hypothetical protein V3U26_07270, partial [Dehalococcoidia bacterium]
MRLIEASRTRKLGITAVLLAAAIAVHYSGIPHDYMSTAVALNIVPVSYAAFAFGVRGAVVVGLLAGLAAIPHSMVYHPRVETVAEIGVITILLVGGVMVGA